MRAAYNLSEILTPHLPIDILTNQGILDGGKMTAIRILTADKLNTPTIENTLHEAEQINRLCRITQPAALLLH